MAGTARKGLQGGLEGKPQKQGGGAVSRGLSAGWQGEGKKALKKTKPMGGGRLDFLEEPMMQESLICGHPGPGQ